MPHAKPKLKAAVPFILTLLGAILSVPQIDEAHAQTMRPFAGLSGKWSGDGSIVLTDGTTERLRCDATYVESGGGDNLDQSLRCASDSYRFDLHISLVDSAGAILGNWSELSRSVQGGISGHDSKGLIQVTARGSSFTAAVTVATHGNEQSVKIRAQSGDLSQVTITLRRSR
jgi:hypothetical protein